MIPASTFQEWNNPENGFTQTSVPAGEFHICRWIPEHKILEPEIFNHKITNFLTSQQFGYSLTMMIFQVILSQK